MSTAAPLVRIADAPTLAVAFWRSALAYRCWLCSSGCPAGALAEAALALDRRERRLSIVAGLFLGAHCAPGFRACSPRWRRRWQWCPRSQRGRRSSPRQGRRSCRRRLVGIGSAVAGAVVLVASTSSVDSHVVRRPAALIGGVLAAAYVTVGPRCGARCRPACTPCATGSPPVGDAGGLRRRPPAVAGDYDATPGWRCSPWWRGPALGHTMVNRARHDQPDVGASSRSCSRSGDRRSWPGSRSTRYRRFPPSAARPLHQRERVALVVARTGQSVAGAPALE